MFPRGVYTPEPSFNALFRLLDDFDSYSREVNNGNTNGHGHHRRQVRTFNPRFDVVETEASYELHGDLAGVEKNNVNLEFTDPQTLVVRGRVERKYEAGTPPTAARAAPAVEDVQMTGALPEKEGDWQDVEGHHASKEHQARVEDEKDEAATAEAPAAATPAKTSTEVAKSAEKGAAPAAPKNNLKYWVSERSVGEFSRTFTFPSRIEQDRVTASLDNGILTISVPKAKKYESRRVAIN